VLRRVQVRENAFALAQLTETHQCHVLHDLRPPRDSIQLEQRSAYNGVSSSWRGVRGKQYIIAHLRARVLTAVRLCMIQATRTQRQDGQVLSQCLAEDRRLLLLWHFLMTTDAMRRSQTCPM